MMDTLIKVGYSWVQSLDV